jgi:hypothetical protein
MAAAMAAAVAHVTAASAVERPRWKAKIARVKKAAAMAAASAREAKASARAKAKAGTRTSRARNVTASKSENVVGNNAARPATAHALGLVEEKMKRPNGTEQTDQARIWEERNLGVAQSATAQHVRTESRTANLISMVERWMFSPARGPKKLWKPPGYSPVLMGATTSGSLKADVQAALS